MAAPSPAGVAVLPTPAATPANTFDTEAAYTELFWLLCGRWHPCVAAIEAAKMLQPYDHLERLS